MRWAALTNIFQEQQGTTTFTAFPREEILSVWTRWTGVEKNACVRGIPGV